MYDNTILKGIRVLDLTRYASGPCCTQILGDMGADVWKVERPGSGDETRTFLPLKDGESGYYHSYNRNKRSISLNYTKPEGRELLLELVKEVDVVVENNAYGVMEKYNIGYDVLSQINPTLIMGSISGFGQKNSPHLKKPAFDGVCQAMGGMISMTGYPEKSVKVGPCIVDNLAGIYCAMGILAALYERSISGKGQHVDVAMLDTCIANLEGAITAYGFTGHPMPRFGNGHPSVGCTGAYDTADGVNTIYMNCSSQKLADRIADAIGHPELKEDERFTSNSARQQNSAFLDSLINGYTSKLPREQVLKEFAEAGIPCGPVNNTEDVFNDPHGRMRGLIRDLDHPVVGKVSVTMTPICFSRTAIREDSTAAPAVGDNNEYVYQEILHKDTNTLTKLHEMNII